MEELVLDRGLKKIAIKDEDGEVITVLNVNVADAGTAERFGRIITDLQEIYKKCENEAAVWKREHTENVVDTDIAKELQINNIRIKYLKQIVEKIDDLFGENTIKNVYGNIIPDEVALLDFVENVIPVMNKLFGKRYEMNRKRYNSGRKGAKV
jgi:rRNA processing protein Gar1